MRLKASLLFVLWFLGSSVGNSLFAAPVLVQTAYKVPSSPQTSVAVPIPAQTAGDLNVLVVGWNNTSASVVSPITDTNGNAYTLAVGPTLLSGSLSQSIYYAKNILGGSNTVTVNFSAPAAYPDIRLLEYSGLDSTAPFDAAVGASGTGTTANSGTVTTTNAADLLVGANLVTMSTTGTGTGYTREILTIPDNDLVEDATVTATGSYGASSTVSSGGWVMQMVAFKVNAQGPPPPPPSGPIAYVQSTYNRPMASSAQSVTVPYPGTQAQGDFNVVIVGWNGTATVNSVVDSNNVNYTLAVGPTSGSGFNNQSIYYTPNVKAGANSITVNFNVAASYPDIRILEYSGIAATNPVDVFTTGYSPTTATGAVPSFTNTIRTTYAPDLLVAGNTIEGLTPGPGPGFTQRLLTAPDGNIAEDRIVTVPGLYSAATGAIKGSEAWVMQMVAFRGATPQAADTTPPSVNVTPPSSGTGTITVTANASDNPGGTGVASVLLYIDSIPYGTSAIAAPYTFSVNTTQFTNGSHSLTALAYDAAGNSAFSNPISVNFSNSAPGNPSAVGVMSGLVPIPIVTVNSALLPNEQVILYEGEAFGWIAMTWDPVLNSINWEPTPTETDIFCSGMEQLGDGRIIVVGGQLGDTNHKGIQGTTLFNSTNDSWAVGASMAFPRWYPTATILQDGRVLVNCGDQSAYRTNATIPEIYNPLTNAWTSLPNSRFPYNYYFPLTFLMPDGRVFAAGSEQFPIPSQVLDLTVNPPGWTPVDGSHTLDGGSAVQYLPGKVLKMGHYGDPDAGTTASVTTAYSIDMTAANPVWAAAGSMHYPRTYHTPTLLPDGSVLVTGGGTSSSPGDVANAVLPAELWSPTTGTWTTLASMNAPRLYHSEALLLPDARVLITGGGRYQDNNISGVFQFNAEFFSPPYLFKGPRPTITSVSTTNPGYGANFTVNTPNATSITAVSLVRYGAATHGYNMSQRFLPLSFTITGGGTLSVTAPMNSYLAPPGNYLLFILNSQGVPSIAETIHF